MKAAVALVFALVLLGCEPEAGESHRYALPANLLEISGLAVAGPETLYAHDDEFAIVHEIDVTTGRIERSFALGNPTIEGDFEGIATDRTGRIYLVTSDGLIYAFARGEHRKRVGYRAHDSGVGPHCEIEGLSQGPDPDHLLMLCKRLRNDEGIARLEIYRWKLGTEHAEREPWISLPLDTFLDPGQRAEFAPSGLDWDAERERLLVVSGRSHLLVELDSEGVVKGSRQLDPALHRQAEGIAILPGCRLALADEGTETAKARLAIYPCPDLDVPG